MLVENSQTADALSQAFETVDGLMAAGQYAKSLSVMLPFVQSGELDPGILERTADCFFEVRDFKSAINVMQHLIAENPGDTRAIGKVGLMLQSAGMQGEAAECFEAVLRLEPNSIPALTALNAIETFDVHSVYARRLIALSEREDLDVAHKALVLHSLGQVAHGAGEFKSAFELFQAAREMIGGTFVPAIFEGMVEEQLASDVALVSETDETDDSANIIFVGGMPMAGSGLVNRILSKHSNVLSVGESTALSRTHGALRMHLAKMGRDCGYWDWLGTLSAEEIDIFRQYYLERAYGPNIPGDKVIVDAHPMGCLEFALAKTLFPKAKFVFMSRNPMDTALANIAASVLNNSAMASKQEWIAQVLNAVYSSAQDYAAKLGEDMQLFSYDALVNEPEGQIRALLDHVGLEFEDDCLAPGELCEVSEITRILGREELEPGTQNQWQNYAEMLEPMKEALGGQAWIDAWQELDDSAR